MALLEDNLLAADQRLLALYSIVRMYADAPGGVNPFSAFCLHCLEPTSASSALERQLLLRWLRPGPSPDALARTSQPPGEAIAAVLATPGSMLPIPDLAALRQSVAERMPTPSPTAASSVRPVVLDPEGQHALLGRASLVRALKAAAATTGTGARPGATGANPAPGNGDSTTEIVEAGRRARMAVLSLPSLDAAAVSALSAEPAGTPSGDAAAQDTSQRSAIATIAANGAAADTAAGFPRVPLTAAGLPREQQGSSASFQRTGASSGAVSAAALEVATAVLARAGLSLPVRDSTHHAGRVAGAGAGAPWRLGMGSGTASSRGSRRATAASGGQSTAGSQDLDADALGSSGSCGRVSLPLGVVGFRPLLARPPPPMLQFEDEEYMRAGVVVPPSLLWDVGMGASAS